MERNVTPVPKQLSYVSTSLTYWGRDPMGLLPDTQNCVLRMRRECRERFPRHRGLAIPTCIMTRAWRTCHDACRDHQLAVYWRKTCSRHSWRMRNPQFNVSGKRPMTTLYSGGILKCIFTVKTSYDSVDIWPYMFNWHCTSTSSPNGSVSNRRQAVVWTNDWLVFWRINASRGIEG